MYVVLLDDSKTIFGIREEQENRINARSGNRIELEGHLNLDVQIKVIRPI